MPEGLVDAKSVPVRSLLARYEEAKQGRKKYDKNWDRNMGFYKGDDQWKGVQKLNDTQSTPVYNKCFEFVETMRGYLSDNRWGIDAIPASIPEEIQRGLDIQNDPMQPTRDVAGLQSPQDMLNDKADKVNKLLDFLWSDTRSQSKLAENLIHVFTKGTGITKSTFDPDNVGESGIGQIEHLVIDPTFFFPDPMATCLEDADYVVQQLPISVRWIFNRFPDKAMEVIKSLGGSTFDIPQHGDRGFGPAPQDEGKRTDLLEFWYNDASILEDGDTGETFPAYPDGRYTLMTKEGVVLDDKKCEYRSWPYNRCVEIPMPGEFWGACTLDKAIEIQKTINQILRTIIDNGLWLVHGVWIVDDASDVTPEDLAGYGPRDVIVKRVGTTVTRDSGAQLPAHLFETLKQQIEAFDRVVGLPDVLRGIVPSRQPVQTTMMQQESGEVRTRERSRRVEEYLEGLGKLWLGIVADHWTDKRSIRRQKSTGGFEVFKLSKKDLEGYEFDLFVKPGSTTPLDVSGQLARAKELRMELQIPIPDSWFLKNSGLSGIEAAIAEMEKAAKMAEQQADQQAAPITPDETAQAEVPMPTPDGASPPPSGRNAPPGSPESLPETPDMGGIPPEALAQLGL